MINYDQIYVKHSNRNMTHLLNMLSESIRVYSFIVSNFTSPIKKDEIICILKNNNFNVLKIIYGFQISILIFYMTKDV